VAEGTLEPVEYSDWAAPIVAVLKPDKKTIPICGDFHTTVNPASKLYRYPIPIPYPISERKNIFHCRSEASLSADEAGCSDSEIPSHQHTLGPIQVNAAPGIFQHAMEQMLRGVVVYMDDILLTGPTEAEHLRLLEEVLKRLAGAEF